MVAKIGSFIETASKFCDNYLSSLISKVKSYLKELKDLNKIEILPNTARLITADVVSMYKNIDSENGLQILKDFLNLHNLSDFSFQTNKIITVMKNNILTFEDLSFQKNIKQLWKP